jgi:hypothetical protein
MHPSLLLGISKIPLQVHMAELEKLQADLHAISKEHLAEKITDAQAKMAVSQQFVNKAAKDLDAAKTELAGLESGDGRDVSSRSLPERLKHAEAEIVRTYLCLHSLCSIACTSNLEPLIRMYLTRCTLLWHPPTIVRILFDCLFVRAYYQCYSVSQMIMMVLAGPCAQE